MIEGNRRSSVGEIDLIAFEGETLCFIEVKARETEAYGPAVAGVSRRQQARIARAAELYLAGSGHDGDCRFDVLAMDWSGESWTYHLLRGAFELA